MTSRGLSFDQLFPGHYIKAGEFDGKTPTLTITAVAREMLSNGTGGEEGAAIVSFKETEKQFVLNKTNGVALRAMFGDDTGEWVGHRVTLHAVKDASGLSEAGICIRVLGSPEIDKPLTFRATLGRKKVTQTMQPTGKGKAQATPTAAQEPESGDAGAFEGTDPEDDDVPGIGGNELAARRKASPAQLKEIAGLVKSTGIYEAEMAALLDNYGGVTEAADLTHEQAGFVIEALGERGAS